MATRRNSLVSVITDVPWTTDAEGAFVTPQAAWAAFTGQSWEELRGFGWTNALHPEDRETSSATSSAPLRSTATHANRTAHGAFPSASHEPAELAAVTEAAAWPFLNPPAMQALCRSHPFKLLVRRPASDTLGFGGLGSQALSVSSTKAITTAIVNLGLTRAR